MLHYFSHLILKIFVYSWFTYCLEWMWYVFLALCSYLIAVVPWRPHIVIPGSVSDLALVSLAFTRVFQSTDFIVPPSERKAAIDATTPEQWHEIQKTEGAFWGPVHRTLEFVNTGVWKLIESIQRLVTYPVRRWPRIQRIVRPVLITIAATVFMWGFLRLGGYLINVYTCRKLNFPIMLVRKKFFRYFVSNLLGALLATVLFFVFNGIILEYFK